MHSLSYVDVDNENDKGFISDRLVQVSNFLNKGNSLSHI